MRTPPSRLLWLGLALYGAGIAAHAYGEITDTFEVQANGRGYQFPRETWDGELIDPRAGPPLAEEICARYILNGCPLSDLSPEALREAGLKPQPAQGFGEGAPPHLIDYEGRPVLVVGRAGDRPVIYDAGRGVVLLHGEISAPAAATALTGAKIRRWTR